MADFNEIYEANKDNLDQTEGIEGYQKINEALQNLGYDVFISDKKKSEFIPSSRLNEVIGQRDNFKTQVTSLNSELTALKQQAQGNEALQTKIQDLLNNNQNLLSEIEKTRIDSEIMITANEAINPKDILIFINRDNIKTNSKGEVMGVDAEIARLKTEKPYLFKTTDKQQSKGGIDNQGSNGDKSTFSMNSMIRRASGRL